MTAYKVAFSNGLLTIGFGTQAQNNQIVKDAEAGLDALIASGEMKGGDVIRVNGPASLPVAMVIAHKVSHLFGAVACFDPKLGKYVVAITHNPLYKLGDLID